MDALTTDNASGESTAALPGPAAAAKTALTDQVQVETITLSNSAGLCVDVLPQGAYLSAIRCFGKDLTLSYPAPNQYLQDNCYLGATVGRFANRIRHGRFSLNQQQYQLDTNANGHCLHGGYGDNGALHQQPWQVMLHEPHQLQLYVHSPHGSCGFPGNLQIWCTITLQDTTLYCHYQALSDQDTVLSLTNHCYFNLNQPSSDDGSEQASNIDNHLLQTSASHYLPVDADTLPTGLILPVAGTAFDFQQPTVLATRLRVLEQTPGDKNGFDHCFVWPEEATAETVDLSATDAETASSRLRWRASLFSAQSGVQLRLFSNKPGMQLYTGQFLAPPFAPRQGLCLEAQHWPDAPNQSHFPSAVLKAGQLYQHQLCYQFLQQPLDADNEFASGQAKHHNVFNNGLAGI